MLQVLSYEIQGTATLMISIFYQKELYKPWLDTRIIEISRKMGKLWAFKEFNIANI